MALKKDYTFTKIFICLEDGSKIEEEHIIKDAYLKIIASNGSKESLSIVVGVFSIDKTTLYQKVTYQFIPSVADGSANFIQQGYEYLKTLPEFADAVDC